MRDKWQSPPDGVDHCLELLRVAVGVTDDVSCVVNVVGGTPLTAQGA